MNIGCKYLADITLKSNLIEIFSIQTTSYADLNTLGNIIFSSHFHNLSYNCAIQALIASSDVDVRGIRPLNYAQSSKLESTDVVYLSVFGFLKHKNQNNISAVCFRLTIINIGRNTFKVLKNDESNMRLVLVKKDTRKLDTVYICSRI